MFVKFIQNFYKSKTKKLSAFGFFAIALMACYIASHTDKVRTFYPTFNQISDYPNIGKKDFAMKDKIYGMIVSHHHYTEEHLAKYLSVIKTQDVNRVIVLSPNHFNAGRSDVSMAQGKIATPYGYLEADDRYIEKLINSGIGVVDNEVLSREHGVLELATYIKAYKSDLKLVPIMLKRRGSFAEMENLTKYLSENVDEKTLVIASIDFSHHMTPSFGRFHDELSLNVMSAFDFERIKDLEIDSRESLYVLMRYLQGKGAFKMSDTLNTSYAEMSGDLNAVDNTSYVFTFFTKGEVSKISKKTSVMRLPFWIKDEAGLVGYLEDLSGDEGNQLRGFDYVVSNAIDVCEKDLYIKYAQGKQKIKIKKLNRACVGNIYEKILDDKDKLVGYIFQEDEQLVEVINKYLLY